MIYCYGDVEVKDFHVYLYGRYWGFWIVIVGADDYNVARTDISMLDTSVGDDSIGK
jgi:hypothetical protein